MVDVDTQLISNPPKKRKYSQNQEDTVICESCNKTIPLKSSIKLYNTTLCLQCKIIFTGGGRHGKSVVDYSESRSRRGSRSFNSKSESNSNSKQINEIQESASKINQEPQNAKANTNLISQPQSPKALSAVTSTSFSTSSITLLTSTSPNVNTTTFSTIAATTVPAVMTTTTSTSTTTTTPTKNNSEVKKVKRRVGRPRKCSVTNVDTQTAVVNTLSTSIVSSSDLPKVRKKRGPKKKKKIEIEKDLPVTNNTIDLAMSMIDTQTAVANTLSTSIVSSSDLPK
ncbi:hypothetical protein PIROE2DRAFT_9616, partial [Piromyces sp. E2]